MKFNRHMILAILAMALAGSGLAGCESTTVHEYYDGSKGKSASEQEILPAADEGTSSRALSPEGTVEETVAPRNQFGVDFSALLRRRALPGGATCRDGEILAERNCNCVVRGVSHHVADGKCERKSLTIGDFGRIQPGGPESEEGESPEADADPVGCSGSACGAEADDPAAPAADEAAQEGSEDPVAPAAPAVKRIAKIRLTTKTCPFDLDNTVREIKFRVCPSEGAVDDASPVRCVQKMIPASDLVARGQKRSKEYVLSEEESAKLNTPTENHPGEIHFSLQAESSEDSGTKIWCLQGVQFEIVKSQKPEQWETTYLHPSVFWTAEERIHSKITFGPEDIGFVALVQGKTTLPALPGISPRTDNPRIFLQLNLGGPGWTDYLLKHRGYNGWGLSDGSSYGGLKPRVGARFVDFRFRREEDDSDKFLEVESFTVRTFLPGGQFFLKNRYCDSYRSDRDFELTDENPVSDRFEMGRDHGTDDCGIEGLDASIANQFDEDQL